MAEQEINYFPPSKHQNSPKLSRTGWTCGDNEIGAGSWEIVIKKAKSVKACALPLCARDITKRDTGEVESALLLLINFSLFLAQCKHPPTNLYRIQKL
jgi:hypothetical protein